MIHLIITSANVPEAYIYRRDQYINSVETCLKYSHLFDSYTILECVSSDEDYLNQYNVYYSKENNAYPNKGLNEMNHLRSYLKNQSSLKDTDAIIKLSGRYIIKDSFFFEKVLELQDKYNSIFKSDIDIYKGKGYHTFLYYMQKRPFVDVINSLNFSTSNSRPIEWDMKNLIKKNVKNYEIDRLGVIAYQVKYAETIFHC